MKTLGVLLSLFVLMACQPSNDQYDGLTGRVMLYQINETELQRVLQQDGIVVIANPDNGWSQQVIPVLNEVALRLNQRVNYFNGVALREDDSLFAQSLIQQIQTAPFLNDYDARLYDQLYMPIVLKIEQGQIVLAHIGTVPSHRLVQGSIPELTQSQRAELASYYESFFS